KDEEVKDENIDDVKDEEVKDETVQKGIVVNCFKLNVRRSANLLAKVLTVIEKGTEVIIANAKTSNGFYKVKVNDIEGYCVKDYIEIK
ncbi:MAG: SH3 domain-containing protein, partial [Bacilli bacterium]|nr:SH3 domain-containing protein [Bacilli bacterium]